MAMTLRVVSGMLGVFAVALIVVPTGSCIA
jgi:hypothetical protein